MTQNRPKIVIFTDLDGTLLDRVTYSYDRVLPSIEYLRQTEIPLVFCSAKTRAEQEVYQRKLAVSHPFIVENGGTIFIPHDYFPFPFDYHRIIGDFSVIELGTPYERIRQLLGKVKKEGNFHFRGFGDMSVEEVAEETSLDIELAGLAKQREYDETVKFDVTGEEVDRALEEIKRAGLNHAHGGHFHDVMGANDKGKAVIILSDLYRRLWGKIKTVGLGDSMNDLPMLSVVDIPVLVQKKDRTWEGISLPRLCKVYGVGPEGWNKAIKEIISAETN